MIGRVTLPRDRRGGIHKSRLSQILISKKQQPRKTFGAAAACID